MDRRASGVDRRFGLVDELLDRQYAVDRGHVVEMAFQLLEPRRDVIAKRVRDLGVMPSDRQIHESLLVVAFRVRVRAWTASSAFPAAWNARRSTCELTPDRKSVV